MRIALIFLATSLASLNLAQGGTLQVEVSPFQTVESKTFGLTGRIINGTKAALRQFPHQVSLRRSWSSNHFCGGALISEYHVLTAGHCMYIDGVVIKSWTIMVVGGGVVQNKVIPTEQKRGVERMEIHPDFDINNLHNDIAVLFLKVPFKLTPELKTAPLPTHGPEVGSVCQVSGWGFTSENIPVVSNDLMFVNLPIIEENTCRSVLENVTDFPPGMFCAGYLEGGKDACQGDSGGGMVCNGILSGIVSGGEGCAAPLFPGVYSNVFFYKKWIIETTGIAETYVEIEISDDNEKKVTHYSMLLRLLCRLIGC